jgi:hypothetical protein
VDTYEQDDQLPPQSSEPDYDPGDDNGILGGEEDYNEDYEADSEEPDTAAVPGNDSAIPTLASPHHTDRPIGPEPSTSLSFPGLAAEGEFENPTDDPPPATRHGSKNTTDSEDKTSDADEKASAADSDHSYDDEAPAFTFAAENESSDDCNYELASEETAVGPLSRLTRSAAATHPPRNVSRQPTVEEVSEGEEPAAQTDAADDASIADPSPEATHGAMAQILPAIFANLFYTFTGCTHELHAQQKAQAAESSLPSEPFNAFLTQIRRDIPLPDMLRHDWIYGHKPEGERQNQRDSKIPLYKFVDDLRDSGMSLDEIETLDSAVIRAKARKLHRQEKKKILLNHTNEASRSMLYTGRTTAGEPPAKLRIDDPALNAANVQTHITLDSDSFSFFPVSPAVFRGGISWLIQQPSQTTLTDSRHLPKRQVWPCPSSPDDRTGKYRAAIHHTPHILLGRAGRLNRFELFIVFPRLFRPVNHNHSRKTQSWKLLEEDYRDWLEHILLPALKAVLHHTTYSHYPTTYDHIKLMVRARHDQRCADTNDKTVPREQAMTYTIPEDVLHGLWEQIQLNINAYSDDRFRDAYLFAHNKNLKLDSRKHGWSSFVDSLDAYIDDALNRIHAGDEDQFYIDIGHEFSRLHTLPDGSIDATVLVWRKCCLEAYDKWIRTLERAKAPCKTKHYPYIQLGETGTMTMEHLPHSRFHRAGCLHSQFYPSSKNFFGVGNVYAYEHPDRALDSLAYDPELLRTVTSMAGNHRRRNTAPIFIAGKAIIHTGLRGAVGQNGTLRSEYMLSMTAIRVLRALHDAVFDDIPLDPNDDDFTLLQSISDDIRKLEKECANRAPHYFEIPTAQFLKWVHWNVNRLCYGFEALYSLHNRYGQDARKANVSLEHSQLMLAFLHSLPFSYGSANPTMHADYWVSERGDRTLDHNTLFFDLDTETGGQRSHTALGLGVCDSLKKYGMAWYLPRIAFDRMAFLPHLTERMLFNVQGLAAPYRSGRVPTIKQAIKDWRELEAVKKWYTDLGPTAADRQPYLNRLCVYLRQRCMLEFRRYIFNKLKDVLKPEFRDDALDGKTPLCWVTLQRVLLDSAQPRIVKSRGGNYPTPDLMFKLFWEDDVEYRPHPQASKARRNEPLRFKRNFEKALFRYCFRESCQLLDQLFNIQVKTQWVAYLRATMIKTCNAWPYTSGGTLLALENKRIGRFVRVWHPGVIAAYIQQSPWGEPYRVGFFRRDPLPKPAAIPFEDTHRWPSLGWKRASTKNRLPFKIELDSSPDDLSLLSSSELQARLSDPSDLGVPAIDPPDAQLFVDDPTSIPACFFYSVKAPKRNPNQHSESAVQPDDQPSSGTSSQSENNEAAANVSDSDDEIIPQRRRRRRRRSAAPSASATIVQVVIPLRVRIPTTQSPAASPSGTRNLSTSASPPPAIPVGRRGRGRPRKT